MLRPIFILIIVLLTSPTDLFADKGTVTGTVPLPAARPTSVSTEKYRGKISGKVVAPPAKIAAVWLEQPGLSAPAKPKPVVLQQKNYQFAKSLLAISKGTTVLFPNSDADFHNIYSLSRTKRFDLGRYKRGENPAPSVLFDKAGFVALRCEIHEHMNANIVVVDSPYLVTTDAAGKFKLTGVPAGTYTLHAQIDRKTTWKFKIRVDSGGNTSVKFPSK